jgi:hypothetical protein
MAGNETLKLVNEYFEMHSSLRRPCGVLHGCVCDDGRHNSLHYDCSRKAKDAWHYSQPLVQRVWMQIWHAREMTWSNRDSNKTRALTAPSVSTCCGKKWHKCNWALRCPAKVAVQRTRIVRSLRAKREMGMEECKWFPLSRSHLASKNGVLNLTFLSTWMNLIGNCKDLQAKLSFNLAGYVKQFPMCKNPRNVLEGWWWAWDTSLWIYDYLGKDTESRVEAQLNSCCVWTK